MPLMCPSREELLAFLEGAVADPQSDEISVHLDGCSDCDKTCKALESENLDFANTFRDEWVAGQLVNEPEFDQLRRLAVVAAPKGKSSNEFGEDVRRLRDYRLVRKIGEGGMGTVYHAVHLHLGKSVALKILPEDKLHSAAAVSRFQQEMRAVGKLSHPNVVSASDAGNVDGRQFLVMELVEGADLARIMKECGPISIPDACEIIRQAALGLEHAHQNGLVHRDVKPSNVMLSIRGEIKLLDLGLAGLNHLVPDADSKVTDDRLTSVGQIIGTLDYMSPEHATSSSEIDQRADVFALGATLFALITGRSPSGNRGDSTLKRIESLLNDPPRELVEFVSDAPKPLNDLLLSMLAKSPDDRPQSAGDVARQLERFARKSNLAALVDLCRTSLDIPSADVDITEDVSLFVAIPQAKKLPESVGSKPRSWAGWIIGSASVILVLLLLAALFSPPGTQPRSQEKAEVVFKQGDWKRAPEVAEDEVKRHPDVGWLHAKAAMLWGYQNGLAESSTRRNYRRHTSWLTRRWQETGEGTNTIPRVCCLYPDGTDQHAAMLKLVQSEEKQSPKDWRYPHSAMMLHCRLGEFDQALDAYERCRRVSPTNRMHLALDLAWKSLALYRLQRGDEALAAQSKSLEVFESLKPSGKNRFPDMWFDYIEVMTILCEISLVSSDYYESQELATEDKVDATPPTSSQPEFALVFWRNVGEKIMNAKISNDGTNIALAVGWRPGQWEWITLREPTNGEAPISISDEDVLRQVGGQPVRSIAIHPNGKLVALGRWYGAVDIFDLEKNKIVATRETAIGKLRKANGVAFNETGDILLVGYQSNRIVVWNWAKNEVVAQKTYSSPVWNVVTCDGNVLHAGKIWNWRLNQELKISDTPSKANWLSPDGKFVVRAEGSVLTISVRDNDELTKLKVAEYKSEITGIAADEKIGIVTSHANGDLRILDGPFRKHVSLGRLHPEYKVRYLQIAADARYVLATTGDKDSNGRLAVWKIGDLKSAIERAGVPAIPAETAVDQPGRIEQTLLKTLQGQWRSGDQVLSIVNNAWMWTSADEFAEGKGLPGVIRIVGSQGDLIQSNLQVANAGKGERTVYALFRPVGDTLYYCGSYDSRPESLADRRKGMYYFEWKRVSADSPSLKSNSQ